MFRRSLSYLGDLANEFSAHAALTQAAALAFYTALSFAPLVLLLVDVGGLLGENTKYELLGQFSRELGPRSADLARDVVKAAQSSASPDASGWRTAVGVIGLLITASAVFGQLQSALNTMWGVVAKPPSLHPGRGRLVTLSVTAWDWLRKRLLSMGMVLVVLLILLVSLVISAALATVVPSVGGQASAARAAEFGVSFLVATLLFAAIFKVLPDASTPWRYACLGAVITSALFNGGKLLLSLYIDHAGVGRNYGEAVGGLVALLVWVYYSSAALLIGAEVTHMLSDPQRRTADDPASLDRRSMRG